jgi:hypothetical protein
MGGVRYNCVEQGYFHKKAIVCEDDDAKSKIMAAKSPGLQKSLGEKMAENTDWDRVKLEVMYQVCSEKFKQNTHLRDFLLQTEGTYLAEDNPQDSYYGIGMSRNSPRSENQANFKTNHLGSILMRIRDESH